MFSPQRRGTLLTCASISRIRLALPPYIFSFHSCSLHGWMNENSAKCFICSMWANESSNQTSSPLSEIKWKQKKLFQNHSVMQPVKYRWTLHYFCLNDKQPSLQQIDTANIMALCIPCLKRTLDRVESNVTTSTVSVVLLVFIKGPISLIYNTHMYTYKF